MTKDFKLQASMMYQLSVIKYVLYRNIYYKNHNWTEVLNNSMKTANMCEKCFLDQKSQFYNDILIIKGTDTIVK